MSGFVYRSLADLSKMLMGSAEAASVSASLYRKGSVANMFNKGSEKALRDLANVLHNSHIDPWEDIASGPRDGRFVHLWIPKKNVTANYGEAIYKPFGGKGIVTVGYYSNGTWAHPIFGEPTKWAPYPNAPSDE